MGLFIGASILTLLEILDYIYEARDSGTRMWETQSWAGQAPGGAGLAGQSAEAGPDWLEDPRALRKQKGLARMMWGLTGELLGSKSYKLALFLSNFLSRLLYPT